MVLFFNLLSIIVLTFWFIFAVYKISKGNKDPILFVICVFYVFFGMPLIFDLIMGMPLYDKRPGFYLASRDEKTIIIYSLFVALVPLFWWKTRPKRIKSEEFKIDINKLINKYRSIIVPLLFIIMVSPLVLWCFSPDPLAYLKYGNTGIRGFSEESTNYHSHVINAIYLSILASAILFMIKKKELFLFFVTCLAPFLFIAIWLNGKRFVLFLVVALFTYLLFNKGILKGKRMVIYVLLVGIVLMAYTGVYQSNFRSEVIAPEERYENFRIDYGRDSVTKLAIYAELDPNLSILEHRGQSLLFNTLFFIPRDWWEEKPYPYPKYVTSAMFLLEPRLWSWGVTTSVIDSAIADFGWFGLLLGPLFITFICRIGARKISALSNPLTTVVACLFLVLHLPAFLPIFALWLLVIIKPEKKQRAQLDNSRIDNKMVNA